MQKSLFSRIATIGILVGAVLTSACTRIETGEVGLRIDMNKQLETTERLPGSWNQTIIGDILTFPVRDISGDLNDKRYIVKENVPMKDVDISFGYELNPSSVAEIWMKQSKSFHYVDEKSDDIYLMFNYVSQQVNTSAYKVIRNYGAMEVNDRRADVEGKIIEGMNEQFAKDGLDKFIKITRVQLRAATPPDEVLNSAMAVVRSQNELKVKENEVEIARKEAQRMAELSKNAGASVDYMDAQSRQIIANAIAAGKVNTIVIPQDFKGIVNVK